MTIEIRMLAWAILLGIVQLLLAAAFVTAQRGLKWNAGARDAPQAPPAGVAGRLERALRNFLETFPMFAAAALAVVAMGKGSAHTALAAQLYFWARLAYVPLYAAGVPYLRSLVWAVSLWSILQLVWALLF
ncbi:MAPEG family protein [Xanthomonas translucens]|uniref:MAPEG family protein n=1 Tax=Xanthomonas campestris pv. translucens TaxID=343 RepID=UPI0002A7AB3D|nr:MAPEG family protein [Xanthomonas translucens]AKK68241.1 membrane protein [Xanthomonas translucens pv. undulosa]AVY66261.1 membrane protein [Xanthomonas translucens pv. undulosa]ELQ11807.1 inner membrane protein [Xanthomonas translucens DAR61454]MBC3972950.1 MAPEG family protein [Xanthomonas translucens pv. undulosa]MCT8271324.1 MAPEG family protein [Xanthomonas translucens pv. undulosa]